MTAQKAICRSRLHSEAGRGGSCSAMTQHYLTTSAAAAVWTSGPSFPFLLCFSFTHTPYYLPEHYVIRCCLYCACFKCETKSVVDLDNSATHSRAMTTDVSKRSLIVESTVSSSWYRRASTLQFYCSSSFNLWVNWINFGPLRPRGHSPMQPGHVSRLDPASRRHW